ncbi:fimbrial protein [Neisseriaceae bacterium TC5R-5]|nr:fimbrial protein [Neisseriaceae bacterium TC5R-5]
MMKKSLLATAIALSVASVAAQATSIGFIGELTNSTCTVDVNGAQDLIIILPTTPVTQLATQGSSAGKKDFTVNVKNCETGATPKVRFVSAYVSAQGNLVDFLRPTNPVKLQLLNTDSSAMSLAVGTGAISNGLSATGTGTFAGTYGVRYYAEAAGASAGAIFGNVQYALTYL